MSDFFDTEKFIGEVERRPCLWDIRITDYASKSKKQAAWLEIAQAMNENFHKETPQKRKDIEQELYRKWKGIRSSFARELQRIKNQPSSHRRQYIHYDHLSFLLEIKNHQQILSSASRAQEEEPVCSWTSSCSGELETTESRSSAPPPPRKKSKPALKPAVVEPTTPENVPKIPVISAEEKSESSRHFLLSLLPDLVQVSEDKMLECKMNIMSVISKFQPSQNQVLYAQSSRSRQYPPNNHHLSVSRAHSSSPHTDQYSWLHDPFASFPQPISSQSMQTEYLVTPVTPNAIRSCSPSLSDSSNSVMDRRSPENSER